MGEPVLIKKLAEDLIELSGLSPHRDVRIEITEMKAGEKLSEVLVDGSRETLQPTRLQKIQAISTESFDATEFAHRLRALEKWAWEAEVEEVYRALAGLNIGFVYEGLPEPWPGSVRRPLAADAPASIGVFLGA
jgi:O-antigen biosynthesis protein WbqV